MAYQRTPKAHLVAAAESYAGVSPFADACYRYYFYECKLSHKRLLSAIATEFDEYLASIPAKYHQAIIATALLELSYPTKNPDRPAFTAKDRAVCMGVSRRQYYRIGGHGAIDNIISNIIGIAMVVAAKVRRQLGKDFVAG